MNRMALTAAAIGALALTACDVNVTSNDARTREALNDIQEGAADLANTAGNVAEETGADLSNAAQDAGDELQRVGNRVENVDIDVDTDGNRAN